jgi:hypothetical protein
MPETPEQIATRLRYANHNAAEINDPDRTPEALVLAVIADAGSIHAEKLLGVPWWASRARRFRCAFDRLKFEGQIRQREDASWECVEAVAPVSAWAAREPKKPAAPAQRDASAKQLTLF